MAPTAGLMDQATAVLVEPVTVAVNCRVWPPLRLAEAGLTLTATTCAGGVRVTIALADLVVSAAEVALTVTVCCVVMVAGAV